MAGKEGRQSTFDGRLQEHDSGRGGGLGHPCTGAKEVVGRSFGERGPRKRRSSPFEIDRRPADRDEVEAGWRRRRHRRWLVSHRVELEAVGRLPGKRGCLIHGHDLEISRWKRDARRLPGDRQSELAEVFEEAALIR